MEWLIDIIKEWLQLYLKGMIVMWSGTHLDIPDGWALCNGTNGTPDLQLKFIIAGGPLIPAHTEGGAWDHTHPFTSNTHQHTTSANFTAEGFTDGVNIVGTDQGPPATSLVAVTGTTDSGSSIPPYYSLAYIMKL
ncbi:MAG TPA: hypothetical protein VMW50_03785 [Dehalococcoidia bacterium]|nr:hypothetical protein [Dehalococcoidia bacterium]